MLYLRLTADAVRSTVSNVSTTTEKIATIQASPSGVTLSTKRPMTLAEVSAVSALMELRGEKHPKNRA